jgi:predicted transglutaminase-like protease
MEKYHHETKFPTLSANPFMIDNNNNNNNNNSNTQSKRNSDKNVSNSTKEQKFLNHNIKEIVIDLNLDEPNSKNLIHQ